MEEDLKILFKNLIERYEKVNSISVGMTMTGKNVIYKKIKVIEPEIEFMKEYLESVKQMEEDIEIIENILKTKEYGLCEITDTFYNAIEKLLKRYKELEEEIKHRLSQVDFLSKEYDIMFDTINNLDFYIDDLVKECKERIARLDGDDCDTEIRFETEIETLQRIKDKLSNNDFQKDKLERNEKDGFKIRTIYKVTELNSALENLIKDYKEKEDEKVIDLMAKTIKELNNKSEEVDCFIPKEYSNINECVNKNSCEECIKEYFRKKVRNK